MRSTITLIAWPTTTRTPACWPHGLRDLGLDVLPQETNIVIATVPDPAGLIAAMAEEGIRISSAGRGRIRCVTHLDVDRAGVDEALAAFGRVLNLRLARRRHDAGRGWARSTFS